MARPYAIRALCCEPGAWRPAPVGLWEAASYARDTVITRIVRSLGSGEDPDSEVVRDHLTSRATFADGEWGLEEAADAMARGGFRHLVVVSNGEVEGIISMRDIMHVWRPRS